MSEPTNFFPRGSSFIKSSSSDQSESVEISISDEETIYIPQMSAFLSSEQDLSDLLLTTTENLQDITGAKVQFPGERNQMDWLGELGREARRVLAPYFKSVKKKQTIQYSKRFSVIVTKKPDSIFKDVDFWVDDAIKKAIIDTVHVLKTVTHSTGALFYHVNQEENEIVQLQRYFVSNRHVVNWAIKPNTMVAAHAAYYKEYVMIDDLLYDDRFPYGIGYEDVAVKSVLCLPIVTPEEHCIGVIQLHRSCEDDPFTKDHLKLAVTLCGWMGAAIQQNSLRIQIQKEQDLSKYLLDITQCFFADNVDLESTINEIVKTCKEALEAEIGILFAVSQESEELNSDVYEEGINQHAISMHKKAQKVCLSKDHGVAGYVARNKTTLNLEDAHSDKRFQKEYDSSAGVIVRSVLAMPIISVGTLLGVIQMINKADKRQFTEGDEKLMNIFCTYCAFILHYASLGNKMEMTKLDNLVNIDLLRFHIRPCIHDLESFKANPTVAIPKDFNTFGWYINSEDISKMPQYILYMVTEMVPRNEMDLSKCTEFILSARKCYRNVAYHNFEHAFNFLHCIYNITIRNKNEFSFVEMKALWIAALCHDIDHGGRTNFHLYLCQSTLAQLYEDSPWEHHHADVCLKLVDNFKMFPFMTTWDYTDMKKLIKESILATDLTYFFRVKGKLTNILEESFIDWYTPLQRHYIRAVMMAAADLSGQAKTFSVVKKITDDLYTEFYEQGDIEKSMGVTPVSLMDRDNNNSLPEDQVQFLTIVTLPCFELLRTAFPNCEGLYDGAASSLATWKDIIQIRGQKSWRQDKSIVIKGD